MEELKEKIQKMEKDIKSIVTNQEGLKEKMQNNNILLKDELVLVLERRLDDKLDILNEKTKRRGWQNEYRDAKHKHLNTKHEHHDTEP